MSQLILPPLRQISSPNYSSRNGAAIKQIVVHDCEGSYDRSISWFAQPQTGSPSHAYE